jgi:hypothetical protein
LLFSEASTTNYSGKDFGDSDIVKTRTLLLENWTYWNIGTFSILFFQSYPKALPESLYPSHSCTEKRLLANVNVALDAEIKPLMTPDYS